MVDFSIRPTLYYVCNTNKSYFRYCPIISNHYRDIHIYNMKTALYMVAANIGIWWRLIFFSRKIATTAVITAPQTHQTFRWCMPWIFFHSEFQIDGCSGNKILFNDIVDYVELLMLSFHKLGVTQDQTVMLCMNNCLEYVYIFLALTTAGITVTDVNPAFTECEYWCNTLKEKCTP